MTRKFFFLGYNAYPTEVAEQYGYTALMFPNSVFGANKARSLADVLTEHEFASAMGFDGSVCAMSITTTFFQRKRALTGGRADAAHQGNHCANRKSPTDPRQSGARRRRDRHAGDLISGGRIISGFVRGTGIEQLSTNANPVYGPAGIRQMVPNRVVLTDDAPWSIVLNLRKIFGPVRHLLLVKNVRGFVKGWDRNSRFILSSQSPLRNTAKGRVSKIKPRYSMCSRPRRRIAL